MSYMSPFPVKYGKYGLGDVCRAAYSGDIEFLEMLLDKDNKECFYQGDINTHMTDHTALMLAAMNGQVETLEMLLAAGADPHMKQQMPYGSWPDDGKTAQDLAKEWGYDDIAKILAKAEKDTAYGVYMKYGPLNNMKLYGYTDEQALELRDGDACPEDETPGEDLPDPNPEPVRAPRRGRAKKESSKGPAAIKAAPAKPKTTIGLLFPGQGSQYVKMLADVRTIPAVKDMLKKSKDILGWDLEELCLKGPEAKLEETKYCQPCMYVAGLAGLEKLRGERAEAADSPGCVAGLSLGEYTALAAAGVFTFEDGLELVKLRGEAMNEAATKTPQAMLSVAGLEEAKLKQLCADAAKKEPKGVCQIANVLFPKGFSVAGSKKCIDELKGAAEKAGALQARLLKTSGGFHTDLMKPAQVKLEAKLKELLPNMKPPECDVYMNVTGKVLKAGTKPDEICKLLSQQLVSSVLWEPSVRNMIAGGMTEFYEVGPMKQLKAMMKRIDPNMWNSTTNVDV